MNLLQRVEHWGDMHHPKWIDIGRLALGVFLCFKGIQLMENLATMQVKLGSLVSLGSFKLILLSHYVIFAHILGGFCLAIGMLTRIACLIQIPTLLGAIFINAPDGVWQPFSELTLAIVCLLGLIYFLVVGSGRWSFDWIVNQQEKK